MEPRTITERSREGAEHAHTVTILLDSAPREIRPGTYEVKELKERLGIDACRDLDQIVGGEFKPLEDNSRVHIKGGEEFVSHARCGGSS
jgi:hypothetical protein